MKKIFLPLIILLFTLLNGCSLTGKSEPLQYFTLNPIENSCLRTINLSGPSYLLSEKIMLKKGPHAIGSINSSYWVTPLQILIPEVLTSSRGTKSLDIKIEELILNLDQSKILLRALIRDCSIANCQESLLIAEEKTNNETLAIVEAYQRILNQVVNKLCS